MSKISISQASENLKLTLEKVLPKDGNVMPAQNAWSAVHMFTTAVDTKVSELETAIRDLRNQLAQLEKHPALRERR